MDDYILEDSVPGRLGDLRTLGPCEILDVKKLGLEDLLPCTTAKDSP